MWFTLALLFVQFCTVNVCNKLWAHIKSAMISFCDVACFRCVTVHLAAVVIRLCIGLFSYKCVDDAI